MLEDGNWKSAEELKTGDRIVTANGDIKIVDSVEAKYYNEARRIFNLNVDDFHTYFVGSDGLLVHNDCSEAMARAAEAVEETIKSINLISHVDAIAQIKDLRYIDKSAKAIADKLSEMCNNGEIRKLTGGKIDSKVVTVAVDENTGKVYYGLSGKNAPGAPLTNPTRRITVSDSINARLKAVKESLTDWDLDNCGEYNAINNATSNGVDMSNLKVYSKYIYGGTYAVPCDNCEALYGGIAKFIGE